MIKEKIIWHVRGIAKAMGAYLYHEEDRMPNKLQIFLDDITKIIKDGFGFTSVSKNNTQLSFAFSNSYVLILKSDDLKLVEYWYAYCEEIEKEGKLGIEISGYKLKGNEIEILF